MVQQEHHRGCVMIEEASVAADHAEAAFLVEEEAAVHHVEKLRAVESAYSDLCARSQHEQALWQETRRSFEQQKRQMRSDFDDSVLKERTEARVAVSRAAQLQSKLQEERAQQQDEMLSELASNMRLCEQVKGELERRLTQAERLQEELEATQTKSLPASIADHQHGAEAVIERLRNENRCVLRRLAEEEQQCAQMRYDASNLRGSGTGQVVNGIAIQEMSPMTPRRARADSCDSSTPGPASPQLDELDAYAEIVQRLQLEVRRQREEREAASQSLSSLRQSYRLLLERSARAGL